MAQWDLGEIKRDRPYRPPSSPTQRSGEDVELLLRLAVDDLPWAHTADTYFRAMNVTNGSLQ